MVEGIGDEVVVFGGICIALACGLIGVLLASILHREDRTPAAVLDLSPPASPARRDATAGGTDSDNAGAAAAAATATNHSHDADDGAGAAGDDDPRSFAVTVKLIATAGAPAQLVLRVGRGTTVAGLRGQIRRGLPDALAARSVRIIFRGAELHDGDARLVALGFAAGAVTHAVVAPAEEAAPAGAMVAGHGDVGEPLPPLGQLPELPTQEAIVLSATFGGFLSCMYLFGLFGSRGFAFFDPAALACLFLLSLAYYICGGIRVLAACLRHEAERWRQRQQRRRPHFD